MKAVSIIVKNFKLILRSRISALIILFGPLLIMLIVGLAFSSESDVRIDVGYYAKEDTNLTASFVSLLSRYSVEPYPTPEDCARAISQGEKHICLVFPDDFRITNNRTNEIVYLVDNSKVNFYGTVVDSIDRTFSERALQLSRGMTQELLNKLNETQFSITNNTLLLSKLREDTQSARENAGAAKGEMSEINLEFDYSSLGIDDLDSIAQSLSDSFQKAESSAKGAIGEARSLMDDMEDEIEDLNLSSSKEEPLLDLINASRAKINTYESTLNATSEVDEAELVVVVAGLRKSMQDLDSRLSFASSARDSSVGRISDITSRLEDSYARVLAVEDAFSRIYANINATSVTDLETITEPVVKRVVEVQADESQLNFFFPFLLVLIIMFIGLLLSSTLVIMERTSMAHFRNFVTPTSDMTFISGAYVTTLIIMVLQLAVVLSIFAFYFGEDVTTNLFATAIVLFLLVTLFSWLGMAIGNIFNTEETGTLASISIGSILLFVSDLIFPLERMPPMVAELSRTYNPFVIGSELLRRTLVFRISLSQLGEGMGLLLLYLLVVLLLLVLSHKFMKRSYLLKWGGYVARRELRMAKQSSDERELLEKYNNLSEQEYFRTKDGKRLGSLNEIVIFIENLTESSFSGYVTNEKNAFAQWVQDVLKNDEYAARLRKAKKKAATLRTIKKLIVKYEKIQKRLSREAQSR